MFSLLMFSLFACGDKDRSFIFGSDSEDSGGYVAPPSDDTSVPEMNLPTTITSIYVYWEAVLDPKSGYTEELCEEEWDGFSGSKYYVGLEIVAEDPNGPDDIASVFIGKGYHDDDGIGLINDWVPATFDGLKWSISRDDLILDSKGDYELYMCAYDYGGLGHCFFDDTAIRDMAPLDDDGELDCI